jgi:UDP-GlcNAc:undecaprenyl-phosphate GlcNAc-1-phosphate transferase
VLILLVPILDTAFVTLTRPLSRRSALAGGRDHTSHRLVALGVSERAAVLSLYALAAGGGALALVLRVLPLGSVFAFVTLYLMQGVTWSTMVK